jgi:hypothetical protein
MAGVPLYPDTDTSSGSCYRRAEAVYKTLDATNPNRFAININFTFIVPLSAFKDLARNGVTNIYMNLTDTIAGGNYKVYNYSENFNVPYNISRTIKIGIQANRVNDLTSKLDTYGMSFGNILDQITCISSNSLGRPQADLNVMTYYKKGFINGSDGIDTFSSNNPASYCYNNPACLYYNYESSYSNGIYTVLDIEKADSLSASHSSVYTYIVGVSLDGAYGGRSRLKDDRASSTMAYIPSFWTKPVDGKYTFITVAPTCRSICDPLTESCPATCCQELCEDTTANDGSAYCRNVCRPVNICASDDPQKEYCCLHPEDPVCDIFEEENPDNKASTCSTTVETAVEYKYPAEGWGKQVLSNSACTISCSEKLRMNFQPMQSVRAGMGFTYPIDISSSRYCTAKYDNFGWKQQFNAKALESKTAQEKMIAKLNEAKDLNAACGSKQTISGAHGPEEVCSNKQSWSWSTTQANIADILEDAISAQIDYKAYEAEIDGLENDRNTCNNYTSTNPYTGATSTSIKTGNVPNQSQYTITSSDTGEDNIYESERITNAETYSIYECSNNKTLDIPTFYGTNNAIARSLDTNYCEYKLVNQTYYDFWNRRSYSDLTFEFATTYYVQRYTGALSRTDEQGYDYDGRKAYTDFYAMSGNTPFSLNVTKLGPNFNGTSNDLWSLKPFTCSYDITNLIFPPDGDENNDLYGNTAFMYRQISLTDPFPNREAKNNWKGKTTLITTKGYSIYNDDTPLYTINFTPSNMKTIRGYGNNYGSYNAKNPYISTLVQSLISSGTIVKGK